MIEAESTSKQKIHKSTITEETATTSYPSVTIGIPTLNEEKHIERVVSGFLESDYPNLREVLVADGGSTDNTRQIIKRLASEDSRVKLVENPERFQSYGLNHMIDIAEGEIFLRADGHCIYADDYIRESVNTILKTKATNVGGSQRYIAKNYVQAATAVASKSVVGNGGAKYMDETFEGYSDTVFLGCFWLKDLKELGGFSEQNRTNEDSEINFRLTEDLGGKVYVSPRIRIWYYPRSSFVALFKQYFRYGRGRALTAAIHKGRIPFRSKAPFLALTTLLVFSFIDQVLLEGSLGSLYIFAACLFLVIFEAFRISAQQQTTLKSDVWRGKQGKEPGKITIGVLVTFVFLVMYVGHFLGYGFQKIRMLFSAKSW